MMQRNNLLAIAIRAAIDAGEEILNVYNSGDSFQVENKEDNTPLTIADRKAHEVIVGQLEKTALPILSEEGKDIPYDKRCKWPLFWMVDPLDGTKEFIKRNGEFTVNIALIENGKPMMGVIWVPVKNWLYFGDKEGGAYLVKNLVEQSNLDELKESGTKLPAERDNDAFTVVASRSHLSDETKEFIGELEKQHDKVVITSMGSSLKICLVAEGKADIYPRFAPTMEWDTAAGHAIAAAAGKKIIDHKTQQPMQYNKPNLLNNWFVVE